MEQEIKITLKVIIKEEELNVNDIIFGVKKIVEEMREKILTGIVECYQEEKIRKLVEGEEETCKLVEHKEKGSEEICESREYVRKGKRRDKRMIRTDIGKLEFEIKNVECKRCGRKFAPINKWLKIREKQKKSDTIEKLIFDVVVRDSYEGSVRSIEGLSGIPIPKTTAHRWVMESNCDEMSFVKSLTDVIGVMADGTGFKKREGKKGENRVAIGIMKSGEVTAMGSWCGKSWEEIGEELKESISKWRIKPKIAIIDGEPGLSEALSKIAEKEQRGTWHQVRDLGYTLWKDDLNKDERDIYTDKLKTIIGIEIPEEDFEKVNNEDKEILKKEVQKHEKQLDELINEFQQRGYYKASEYLQNASHHLFTHIKLWLETGLVSPKTTSILENIVRGVGRRIKKIAYNWSDEGAKKISSVILKKISSAKEWNKYWNERLDIKNRCIITFNYFQVSVT